MLRSLSRETCTGRGPPPFSPPHCAWSHPILSRLDRCRGPRRPPCLFSKPGFPELPGLSFCNTNLTVPNLFLRALFCSLSPRERHKAAASGPGFPPVLQSCPAWPGRWPLPMWGRGPLSFVPCRGHFVFYFARVPAHHPRPAQMYSSLCQHLRQNKFSLLPSTVLSTYFHNNLRSPGCHAGKREESTTGSRSWGRN